MSAVVEHTVHERITRNNVGGGQHGGGVIIMTSQSGTFQLAPLPVGFVPRRLGFANSDGESSSSGQVAAAGGEDATTTRRTVEEYVPVTRRSRLPAAKSFTTITKCKDKAVKKAFMSLANGEMKGCYQVKTLSDPAVVGKEKICMVLRIVSPTTAGTDMAPSTTTTTSAQQQQQLQGTTLMELTLNGDIAVLRSNGKMQRTLMLKKSYNERCSNALTLDEQEYLDARVLHLFLRALARELPFIVLRDAVSVLDGYYSQKKFLEQALDLNIVKADVGMTIVAAADQDPWEFVKMLIFVGEYVEITATVNQDHVQAGYVYEFITHSYGSKVSFDFCAMIHHNAGLAFQNGQDMNKAEEHLLLAWHMLSSCTGGDGVDINGDNSISILTTILILYQKISEGTASQPRARQDGEEDGQIIDIYPFLCGVLYLAGFQARKGGQSHASVFRLGPQVATAVFRGNLDQSSARNVLLEAGARPDPNHFRQSILQAKGDVKIVIENLAGDSFPGKDDAKRNAKIVQKQIKKQARNSDEQWKSCEFCANCGAMERPNGQPNFRCPCHKASYCSKECQASHRKEHKKICIAVPKKGK